ncbi:MAG: RNA-binding protein [Elusimicrobiota bacterium]
MGKKLFVGGLPYEMNDAQLKELFGACGSVVSAKVIIDRALNKSKGFGFVEMTTDAEAAAALLKYNNFTLGTRRIMVNEARPMEPRPAGGFPPRPSTGGGGGGGGKPSGGFGERNPNFGADSKAFSDRKNRYDNKKKPRGEGFEKKGGKGGKKGGKGHDDDDSGW